MKKLESIQQNKLISSYGGVGSIIETNTNGALLILPYDSWPCFQGGRLQQVHDVEDPRLLAFVQNNGYRGLARLVSIPTPDFGGDRIRVYNPGPDDRNRTVGSKYFPEWYFCTNCHRLKRLAAWRECWNQRFPDDQRFNDNEPACSCKIKIGQHRVSRKMKLQQVRFVMVDMLTGNLEDVPFDKLWGNAPANGTWQITREGINSEIFYKTTENNDGLQGIILETTIDGEKRCIRFSEIYANYLIKPGNELRRRPPIAYKLVMRGSQSLYLPNIVRSLYIPQQEHNAQTDDEMNIQEFRYLTNDENYHNTDRIVERNCNLIAVRKNFEPNLLPRFISRITALERIKETSVLLSYSRLAKPNEQRQWYDVNTNAVQQDMIPGSKRPFDNDNRIDWMPAVEAYGEGILFELDINNIEQENRTIFVHTYCHIVMKEMEFQCGYPLTSLKEKIFVDNDNNAAGFLIYTIAGSEGSFGGLVSLTNDNRILRIVERGAERAKHCPNDPICINDGDAHCFACLDIPETSCTKFFNSNLNRRIFLNYFFPAPNAAPLPENERTDEGLRDDNNDIDAETGIRQGVTLA